MSERSVHGIDRQPISQIEWVPRDWLVENDYNPNHVAPPELELLKLSILEDGWTQPIVVFELSPKKLAVVDGAHRWRTSALDEVAAMTNGRVPVVRLKGKREDLMIATIRHNRARGVHGVLPMAAIVGELLKSMPADEIERRLQMEDEEVNRLAEKDGLPDVVRRTKDQFSSGWVPGRE
jgi:ParB-like chromosome segregation protein Spo0J